MVAFWWSAASLTSRWKPFYWGAEERGYRTWGLRLPGGVLFLRLWHLVRSDGLTHREARRLKGIIDQAEDDRRHSVYAPCGCSYRDGRRTLTLLMSGDQ